MKRILISLLLQSSPYGLLLTGCPLTIMAMNYSDNPTLYLQSRLHYCEQDSITNEQLPKTIVCSPVMRYFGYYDYDDGNKTQFFDRCDGTDNFQIFIKYLSYDRPYCCRSSNKEAYPYYKILASVLNITKTSLCYDCRVDQTDLNHISTTKNYTVDIPLPTTYNTSTRCTLLFSNIDEQPHVIFPHLITTEQKKSLLALLNPQYWINIKATYEPQFHKRNFEFAEPQHMPKDTDLE